MAINTKKEKNFAYSINPRGSFDQLNFHFEPKTEVYKSCSTHWQNNHYVFGGDNEEQQVSVVNGNRLERKATLNFDFQYGACTVLHQIIIVLCFGKSGEFDVCRKSNNPLDSFTKLPNSNYRYLYTSIASIDGKNKIS